MSTDFNDDNQIRMDMDGEPVITRAERISGRSRRVKPAATPEPVLPDERQTALFGVDDVAKEQTAADGTLAEQQPVQAKRTAQANGRAERTKRKSERNADLFSQLYDFDDDFTAVQPTKTESMRTTQDTSVPERYEEQAEKTSDVQAESADVAEQQNGDISVKLNPDELLRKQRIERFTKPRILLETPYTVTINNKIHTRYRIETDNPATGIPDEISSSSQFPVQPIDEVDEEAQKQLQKQEKKEYYRKEICSWVATICFAVIIALLIRSFVFINVRVDGGSMNTTLLNHDYLFVLRTEYLFTEPERQDIVICNTPESWNLSKEMDKVVKRIIGMPGDTLSVVNGYVYINGTLLDEPYIDDDKRGNYNMAEVTVPEGYYFVMGDNRADSFDSRKGGPIKREYIIGEAKAILLPFDRFGAPDKDD